MADIVAIDEAQFFPNLKKFVECCLSINKCVILAGLDADSFQRKFGELIDCIPLACDVTKLSALCMRCKDGTPRTLYQENCRRQNPRTHRWQ